MHQNWEGELMPLVRIDLLSGKSLEYKAQIGEVVYRALVDIGKAPKDDRFQVITEHAKEPMPFDRDYFGIHRTDDCVFIQITWNAGRSVEVKQQVYKAIADGLHETLNLRKEDVFINVIDVAKENWSFGNGLASYVS
jgi:4-oxalocrotonate tautomerase